MRVFGFLIEGFKSQRDKILQDPRTDPVETDVSNPKGIKFYELLSSFLLVMGVFQIPKG